MAYFGVLVGGRAVMVDPKGREPALSARADSRHGTKAHIGRVAADLIAADEVVFFDGGSTALAIARALRGSRKALTVLTRSLLVAAELAEEPDIEIFVLGGRLNPSEMVTSSSTTADDLKHYNVDTYVMGISGVHPTRGLTDYDPDESVASGWRWSGPTGCCLPSISPSSAESCSLGSPTSKTSTSWSPTLIQGTTPSRRYPHRCRWSSSALNPRRCGRPRARPAQTQDHALR